MSNTQMYRADEICKELNISNWTLMNWYRWEKKLLNSGEVEVPYLPVPERVTCEKGQPRIWTSEQLEQLKDFKKHIIVGRNGSFGKYSNPNHFNTKKYKKSIEVIDNA